MQEQIERLKLILSQIKKVMNLTSTMLVIGDLNLDISVNKDTLGRDDVKKLMPIYQDFISENSLAIINRDFERYQSNQLHSLLDHLLTNVPIKFDNVITKKA